MSNDKEAPMGVTQLDVSASPVRPTPNVQVTVFDPVTGDTQKAELRPDDHIVLTGEEVEIASYQRYANGTVQLTIKRKADHT